MGLWLGLWKGHAGDGIGEAGAGRRVGVERREGEQGSAELAAPLRTADPSKGRGPSLTRCSFPC